MERGFIYFLSHEEIPGLLKIGRTKNSIKDRALQIKSDMGLTKFFKIEHVQPVDDYVEAENYVHSALEGYRSPLLVSKGDEVSRKTEFFNIGLSDALVPMFDYLNVLPSELDKRKFSLREAELGEEIARNVTDIKRLDLQVYELELEIERLKDIITDLTF